MDQNDYERELEEMTTNKGKFKTGFLIGLLGYGVNVVLNAAILCLLRIIHTLNNSTANNPNMFKETLGNFYDFFVYGAIFGVIIWLPLAIISGLICRATGKEATVWFVASAIFVILLFVGGTCSGLMG